MDEAHLRARISEYREAFKINWPHPELSFATKANSTLGVLRIASEEGCHLDVASEGEFRAALLAGADPSLCHLHGNNKSRSEIEFALTNKIGKIVLDHFGEIDMISSLWKKEYATKLVIRLAPGVDPVTHAKISTGQSDTKFGFNITDGSGERALQKCLGLNLPIIGFHCHVGSQLLDPSAQEAGGALIAEFARQMEQLHGYRTQYLNVGGGLGVRYTDADVPMDILDYNRLVTTAVRNAMGRDDFTLGQEPGRSLVAESGVTLYTVGVVKSVPTSTGTRTYVAVDGGLADNPRPALYGSPYTVERAGSVSANHGQFTVSGRHCETDRLFENIALPNDLAEGDILQVLCTGAYNSSMASNYNRYPRPPVVLLSNGGDVRLIARRDSYDEMFARETA